MPKKIKTYSNAEESEELQSKVGQLIENLNILKADLSTEEWTSVTELQRSLCQDFGQDEKREITYFGRRFIALPSVFPPRPDSMELVQNMEIRPGDHVLDVCSGSGVIGIFAALKGAAKVVELEINENATQSAKENARMNGVEDKLDIRNSDMFEALKPNELFDVITINPPFRNLPVDNLVQRTVWDQNFLVHQKFLSEIKKYAKPQARMYMAQANFGDLSALQKLLNDFGFKARLIGQRPLERHKKLIFYAFELIKDK